MGAWGDYDHRINPREHGGVSLSEGGHPARSGRGRTPPDVRRFARHLRRVVDAVRAEQRQRGVAYRPAGTEEERLLYRALIRAEAVLHRYRAGAYKVGRPSTPVD